MLIRPPGVLLGWPLAIIFTWGNAASSEQRIAIKAVFMFFAFSVAHGWIIFSEFRQKSW